MTKEELVKEAEVLGLKIKGSFMDDFGENVAIAAFFFFLGWLGHWLWML